MTIESSYASGDVRDSEAVENIEGLGIMTNIRINGGNKLFPDANQYDHFTKFFHKVRSFIIIFQHVVVIVLTIL